jgi:hypothetical protein
MKANETEEVYKNACLSKRVVPQQEECKMWHKSLAIFDAPDVRTALDGWWRSTERDFHGELRSRFLPSPGELIPLVQSVIRQHHASLTQELELVGRKCEECGITTAGFNRPDDYQKRYCQAVPKRPHAWGEICGADMREVYRGSAA